MRPVGTHSDTMDFVGQARGIHFCANVASLLCLLHGAGENVHPFPHDGGNTVVDDAAPAIKFKRSGAEETAPTEYALLHQDKPQIDEAPKSGHAPGSGDSRPRDLVDENLTGNLDGGQLQLFLGTKVCKKTALAHAKLGGEGTDGQAVEAVHGGDVHG